MEKIKLGLLILTTALLAFILVINISVLNSFKEIAPDINENSNFPAIPILTKSNSKDEQETKTKEIANYKELCNSILSQKVQIIDAIVVKSLLPLFNTLVDGIFLYIFAKLGIAGLSYLTQRMKYKYDSENKE